MGDRALYATDILRQPSYSMCETSPFRLFQIGTFHPAITKPRLTLPLTQGYRRKKVKLIFLGFGQCYDFTTVTYARNKIIQLVNLLLFFIKEIATIKVESKTSHVKNGKN